MSARKFKKGDRVRVKKRLHRKDFFFITINCLPDRKSASFIHTTWGEVEKWIFEVVDIVDKGVVATHIFVRDQLYRMPPLVSGESRYEKLCKELPCETYLEVRNPYGYCHIWPIDDFVHAPTEKSKS